MFTNWFEAYGWGFRGRRDWSMCIIRDGIQRSINIKTRAVLSGFIVIPFILQSVLLLCGDIHQNPGPGMTDITICHCNIRSIRNTEKMDHIACSLADEYKIITLSETWLHSKSLLSHLSLPNFQQPYRRDRDNDTGYGGVLAWVANDIAAKRRKNLEIRNLEAMWLEIRVKNIKFLLCVAYRPPNDTLDFWDSFQQSIDLAKETDIPSLIITGDLNCDLNSPNGQKLKKLVDNNHLVLHIDEPTRITPHSKSILDQFISNIPRYVRNVHVDPPVSTNDHCTIGMDLLFRMEKAKPYQRLMWDFKNADFDKFRTQLSNGDLTVLIEVNDVNEACQKFTEKLLSTAKGCIPNKVVTVRPSDKPWFSNELRRLLRKKNRAHKNAKRTNFPHHWVIIREIRNAYCRAIDRSKKLYKANKYDSLIINDHVSEKKWWHILKGILGQTSETQFPPLHTNNQIIVNDRQKAVAFNNFFAKASDLDDSNHPLPDEDFNVQNQLNHIIITEIDVMDQLAIINTNKAYGPDGVPPRLLKEAKNVISKPLSHLFNKSLQTHSFPKMWKMANVLPIFKKGDKNTLGNYRPISLLNSMSKIFEKIIFKYLYNHFKDNFLISIWQSGFQPSLSTVTQLIELYHQFCKAVSEGKEIRVVFLDISKAFDRVWHKGLLFKLKKFGVGGTLLDWFTNYLKDRCQRVIINGQKSDWQQIKAGVPQGSNLGPLLFLVFINDIVYVIQHCQIRLFADDTCLYITVDDRNDAAMMINSDLARVQSWADQWLINFSPAKTKTLLISNKGTPNNHPNLTLQGHVISSVQDHKHLGVVLSHNLRWSPHINDVVSRCTKKINMLKQFKFELDRKSLETIYLSFIRPSMEYGDVLFAGTYESDLCKLDRLQVEAMRIVTGATEKSNIVLLYEDLGWTYLETRRQQHCLTLMYNVFHGLAPQYLQDILPKRLETPGARLLRSQERDDIPVLFTRTESYRRSFIPYATGIWNKLSRKTRNSPSLDSFKGAVKGPKKTENKLYYSGKRIPSIHHSRMRIGCSKLNAHLCYNLHVIPTPQCQCGCLIEDPNHFFFTCPRYFAQRTSLFNLITHISNNINVRTLLYGDPNITFDQNVLLFEAIHKYIMETHRFD